MHYHHRFEVHAPLTAVADFHRQSASMGAITPPPVIVRVHSAPSVLRDGDEMDFTMWLGPLPVRWVARIKDVTPTGFIDQMITGPFALWEHRHTFVPIHDAATAVVDDVHAQLSPHPLWRVIGLAMWLNMAILFAYRGWKTRRLLEGSGPRQTESSAGLRIDNTRG